MKHGLYCKNKKYYCIDCKKEISVGHKRCNGCAKKGNKNYFYNKLKGINNPFYNKKHTKKTKIKQSLSHKKNPSKHKINCFCNWCKAKRGETKMENSPSWKGGKSFEPYPLGWNKIFKEQIRFRDEYKCQLCGVPEVECSRKLHVHHIDYNKENLNVDNLISLCNSCHIKTNWNRNKWKIKLGGLINDKNLCGNPSPRRLKILSS